MKNSKHLLEAVKCVCELLVSFDVSSLFTNVPIDEAVQVIQWRLAQDDTLAGRTAHSPDQVAELLDMCMSDSAPRSNS